MTDLNSSDYLLLPSDLFLLKRQNKGFQIPFFISSEAEASRVRPPAVVKTLEQRLLELTARELAALEELRAKVKYTSWYVEGTHDDWMLLRYLTSRNFDVKQSFKMLERSVQWRKTKGVDEWVCDICVRDPNQHLMQFVGWDLQHRPVCFMSMRWGPERKEPITHCVCTFNHLEKLMPIGVEQWVCITDFETYSQIKDLNIKMATSVVHTIQDHFPERLGLMILVNAPKIFGFFWKMFSSLIDSKTRSKVRFVSANSKQGIRDEFYKLFPKDLSDYLVESYIRSKENVLPTSLVWYPGGTAASGR